MVVHFHADISLLGKLPSSSLSCPSVSLPASSLAIRFEFSAAARLCGSVTQHDIKTPHTITQDATGITTRRYAPVCSLQYP
jgi:hypothetical protein